MPKNKPISDALESRLNSLKKNEYIHVMIIAKSKDGFKSLTYYLADKGVDFGAVTTLNTVSATLTKKKIYSIAKLDYVSAILENQKVYPTF